jgi:hypothetical protein
VLGPLLAAVVAAPCPALQAVLPQTKRAGAVLVGDVDGDRRRDRVELRIAPKAPVTCGVLVVARTARGTRVARVHYGSAESRLTGADLTRGGRRGPSLAGLYALDDRRGLDVVVTAWEGASNTFLQFFATRSGKLVRLAAPRAWPSEGASWGGFASSYSGIDCARGLIRRTSAGLSNGRWDLWRDFYRVGPNRIRLVRSQHLRGSWRLTRKYGDELSQARPFPSCRGVAARRASG